MDSAKWGLIVLLEKLPPTMLMDFILLQNKWDPKTMWGKEENGQDYNDWNKRKEITWVIDMQDTNVRPFTQDQKLKILF